MPRRGTSDFIVILPKSIISIPQDHPLSWLTLFYALPKELVKKRAAYLELPRNIHQIFASDKYTKMIQTDAFLELVWDCFAWAVWQFFRVPTKNGYKEIPGDWSHYSGTFPLWRLSYEIPKHFRKAFETEMEWSFQRLFLMPYETTLPWLTYQQFSNLVGNLTDRIIEQRNWQPMIDAVWHTRQPDDYNGKNLTKRDFMRSWTHSRTAASVSLEEIMESGISVDSDMFYDIPDPCSEFEQNVISEMEIARFKSTLSEINRKILQMRYGGFSLQEIANAVGLKTASAVSKHIAKIADAYEAFVTDAYGAFLDKHIL